MINTLINDDCFNALPKIKEHSVDLVLVDLPYGQTSCVWDSVIDLEKMWKELKQCCTKKCVYVFFCTTKFGYTLIKSNPKWFRYDLVWQKNKKVGFLNANKQPLRSHEMIYVFGANGVGGKTYNPQKTKGKPFTDNRTSENKTGIYGDKKFVEQLNTGTRHPVSIIKFEPKIRGGKYNDSPYGDFKSTPHKKSDKLHPSTILKFNNPSKSLHRTQKPLDLCEWLIKSYSNEDDFVLDFTCGSGTTAIACMNTKRNWICVEKDTDIYNIAKKRIDLNTNTTN